MEDRASILPDDERSVPSESVSRHWGSDKTYDLSVVNLTYKVLEQKGKEKVEKVLLNQVNARAVHGEILAVMGPPGSSKTTFLDAIAGRIEPDSLEGSVLVNGNPVDSSFMKVSQYVMQDDALSWCPQLTVTEALMCSARFRLPRSISHAEKLKRVEFVIEQLGLKECAQTIVGNDEIKGVSGGERRRVSIGVELIHDPAAIFLDEPTSGLDSTSALHVIEILSRLAVEGKRLVILTIHQPSSPILDLLNKVLILARGNVVYHGRVQPMTEFFEDLGWSIPENVNVVEFALDSIEQYQDDPVRFEKLIAHQVGGPVRDSTEGRPSTPTATPSLRTMRYRCRSELQEAALQAERENNMAANAGGNGGGGRGRCLTELKYAHFGDHPDDDAESFIKLFENLSRAKDEEAHRLIIFGALLRGLALHWFSRVSTGATPPATWEALKTSFLERFSELAHSSNVLAKIKNLRKRRTEAMRDYIERFYTLLDHVPRRPNNQLGYSEEMAVDWFASGLTDRLNHACREGNHNNLVATIAAAEKEATRIATKRSKGLKNKFSSRRDYPHYERKKKKTYDDDSESHSGSSDEESSDLCETEYESSSSENDARRRRRKPERSYRVSKRMSPPPKKEGKKKVITHSEFEDLVKNLVKKVKDLKVQVVKDGLKRRSPSPNRTSLRYTTCRHARLNYKSRLVDPQQVATREWVQDYGYYYVEPYEKTVYQVADNQTKTGQHAQFTPIAKAHIVRYQPREWVGPPSGFQAQCHQGQRNPESAGW